MHYIIKYPEIITFLSLPTEVPLNYLVEATFPTMAPSLLLHHVFGKSLMILGCSLLGES